MKPDDIINGLGYLATPYSKYPLGTQRAFVDTCILTARLLKKGLNIYSPIAHDHYIALYGQIDPHDLSIWIPFNKVIMSRCDYLLVALMPSWEKSKGMAAEIDFFNKHDKPIFKMNQDTLSIWPWVFSGGVA
jgi:Domain of unknown function (DUF1937)